MVRVLAALLFSHVCEAPSVTFVERILVERFTFPALLAMVMPPEPMVRVFRFPEVDPDADEIVVVSVLLKTKVPIVVLTAIRGVRAEAPLKVAISEVPGTPAVQLVPVAQSEFVAPVQIESAALTYKAMGSRRNVVRAPARAERKRCCRDRKSVV
jgi:hypothetical protein